METGKIQEDWRQSHDEEAGSFYRLQIKTTSPLEKYPAKQHARDVALKLDVDQGLVYLPGAPTVYLEDSDQPRPFRQRRYFYYLSGVNEPDCHVTYDIEADELILYIPQINPKRVIWNGRGSTIAEAYDKYDVDGVLYSTKLHDTVESWMEHHEGDVYILHPTQAAKPGDDKSPRVNYTKLQQAADECRVIKDPHEIGLIRKANEITARAHRKVLSSLRNFKNEAQVEAMFLDACVSKDAKHQAYEIIAASGENASTLHYVKNDEPLAGRQLMCLDAGCEWQNYASDVTRTFPLSGSWPSKEAKDIHDLVQHVQSVCIEQLRPGTRFLEVHMLAHKVIVDGLLKLGILHNGSAEEILAAGTSLAFFPHGLGHHMGLEVHDVSGVPINTDTTDPTSVSHFHHSLFESAMFRAPVDMRSGGLREGMVVTVEPGIYFSRYALSTVYLPSPIHSKFINKKALKRYLPVGGVRIEDDILITANGYENLTTAPKGDEMLKIIRGVENTAEDMQHIDYTATTGLAPRAEAESRPCKPCSVPPRDLPKYAASTKKTDGSTGISLPGQSAVMSSKSTGYDMDRSRLPAGLAETNLANHHSTDRGNTELVEGFGQFLQKPSGAVPHSAAWETRDWCSSVSRHLKQTQDRKSVASFRGSTDRHSITWPYSNYSHAEPFPDNSLVRNYHTRPTNPVLSPREQVSIQSEAKPQPAQTVIPPRVPRKTPELPQKPLAYRHSTSCLISQAKNQSANLIGPPSQESKRASKPQVWPSQHIFRLAAEAATYLNSIPENWYHGITGDEILAGLESQLTYVELCIYLHSRSVRLDRVAFARALLSAIPEETRDLPAYGQLWRCAYQPLGQPIDARSKYEWMWTHAHDNT